MKRYATFSERPTLNIKAGTNEGCDAIGRGEAIAAHAVVLLVRAAMSKVICNQSGSMSLRVYNTLTKEKEIFDPVRPGRSGIYLCGPTVYKSPHIGHMVGPVIFDAIKRYLRYKGFEVTWIVNITDVEDKLIDAAQKQNTTVQALAEKHTAEYLECLARLGDRQHRQIPQGVASTWPRSLRCARS